MKYDRLLIDVSNMYYRAFHTSKHLTAEVDGEVMETGGIFTVLKMFKRLREQYASEGSKIYYLFDNASSSETRRKDIDPDYKVNRHKQSPSFYRGLDYLYLVLQVLNDGDRLIRRPGSEADDLVEPVLKSFGEKDYSVLLVSNDMDWSRSLNEKVHWLVKEKDSEVIYTKESYKDKYGFEPSIDSVCLYKAIRGDASDNIPAGVKNIREETLLKLLASVSSLSQLFENLETLELSDKWKQDFVDNKARLFLNLRLVSFQNLSVRETREFVEPTFFNKKVLILLYKSLKFNYEKMDSRLCEGPITLEPESFFGEEPLPRA